MSKLVGQVQAGIEKILNSNSFEPFHSTNTNATLEKIRHSSMDLILLCVSLEKEFGVQFLLEEIYSEDFTRIDTLTSMIKRKGA